MPVKPPLWRPKQIKALASRTIRHLTPIRKRLATALGEEVNPPHPLIPPLMLALFTALAVFPVIWRGAGELRLDRAREEYQLIHPQFERVREMLERIDGLEERVKKLEAVKARQKSLGGTVSTGGSYPTGACPKVDLLFPVAGGIRVGGFGTAHLGIDIQGDYLDPILASADGLVAYAGWATGGYGYTVWLNIGGGVQLRYAHLASLSVKTGQFVSRGQVIGKMGATGNATGVHLHWERLCSGVKVNPL